MSPSSLSLLNLYHIHDTKSKKNLIFYAVYRIQLVNMMKSEYLVDTYSKQDNNYLFGSSDKSVLFRIEAELKGEKKNIFDRITG